MERQRISARWQARGKTLAIDATISGFAVLLLTYALGRRPDLAITLLCTAVMLVIIQALRNKLQHTAALLLDSADMEETVSNQARKAPLLAGLKNLLKGQH